MGHMGDAFDVAHAALFLASDDARYITGTQLVVDGGADRQVLEPRTFRGTTGRGTGIRGDLRHVTFPRNRRYRLRRSDSGVS